jgi:hypothetical protein
LLKEVLKPILYADIFDYPLTFEEIYTFLEAKISPETLQELLDGAVARQEIILVNGFYSLYGKNDLAARRQERQAVSHQLWPKALYFGRWIAGLPFVKMVSVTGSLAVENPRNGVDDIDYLVITRPGRLWLCRALIILIVRYSRFQGINLCPNYLLTEQELYFADNNLFTAREMLQMVPLYGTDVYLRMREMNGWVVDYLPQGTRLNLDRIDDRLSQHLAWLKRLGEVVLGGFLGNLLEEALQKLQITKHRRQAVQRQSADTVIFTADQCKGHYDGHNNRIMHAYLQRLQEYELRQNGRVKEL